MSAHNYGPLDSQRCTVPVDHVAWGTALEVGTLPPLADLPSGIGSFVLDWKLYLVVEGSHTYHTFGRGVWFAGSYRGLVV